MERTTSQPEYQSEFRRAYTAVLAAFDAGYHLPYANIHDDEALWLGYNDGFDAGVRDIGSQVRA